MSSVRFSALKYIFFTGMVCCLVKVSVDAARSNVLFIAVDDLRPQTGYYGDTWMITPNIDRLAASSRVFNRHYVQVATCGASRHALLTKKYWDLYDPEKFPAIPYPEIPDGIDVCISLHPSFELMGQYDVPEGGLEDPEYIRKLRHGYCAAVSYTDTQIGKVLDELDRLELSDNTIIVLWGDHGWHLGDLGTWGKHTAYEYALRSPLIVKVPGMKAPGVITEALTETVDIYPTLAELCGLPTDEKLDGKSFVEVLNDPALEGKPAAFGYHRPWACKDNPHSPGPWAITIRTDRYRFTRWRNGIGEGEIVDIELYDHQTDPWEYNNIANQQPDVVEELLARLEE